MKDGGLPLLTRGMKDGGVPLLATERHEGWRGATVGNRKA